MPEVSKYTFPEDFDGTFWTVINGDYYVSSIGSDVPPADPALHGSPKFPFLTIHKAFEVAEDGDKVVVGPDEFVTIEGLGKEPTGSNEPCRVATVENIDLETGGLISQDNVTLVAGDRVLVWKQTDPIQNGIYIAGANDWKRANDFSTIENAVPGKLIPVLEGSANGQTIFQFTTQGLIEVGTTALNFDPAAASDWGQIQGDITAQSDLSSALNDKLNTADVVDNLLSTNPAHVLSANQGNVLKGLIDNINTLLSSDDTDLDELQEVVNFIKQNKSDLDTLGISNIAGLQAALDATGDVTKTGSPDNNHLAVWGANEELGSSDLLTVDPTNNALILNNFNSLIGVNSPEFGGTGILQLSSGTGSIISGSGDAGIMMASNSGDGSGIYLYSGAASGSEVLISSGGGSTGKINFQVGSDVATVNGQGTWDFHNNSLTNVADPVNAQDAATKAYVDANGAGGSGDVTKVGTPANNQLAVWTGDGSIEGSDLVKFDSTTNSLLFGGTTPIIGVDTVLSGDDKYLVLTGGGGLGSSRGANIRMHGNEASGNLALSSGNADGADIYIQNNSSNGLIRFWFETEVANINPEGIWDFNNHRLTNLAEPVDLKDAATKDYVDSAQILELTDNYMVSTPDNGKILNCNGTLTISLVNGLSTGFNVQIVNVGTGVVTIFANNLSSKNSATQLANQYGAATVYSRGDNGYVAIGDLS